MAKLGSDWIRPTLKPVWLILPIVGALVAASLEPIPPHDYWWHLVFGREIAGGSIPATNLFLYTLDADLPFLDQPWLGQLLMYQAYGWGGHAAGVLLRNFLLVIAIGIALHAMWQRSRNSMACGITALVCVMLTVPVLTVRTRMFAFVPYAVLLWTITYAAENPRRAWVLFLNVATTAFWANVHGTFVLAPVLLTAVTGSMIAEKVLGAREHEFRELLTWASATVATGLSVALTPSGLEIYRYVLLLSVTSNVSSSVSEWQPPSPAEPIGQLFMAVLAAGVTLLAMERKRLRIYEALIFAAGTVLAAGAVRSMFWFALATALVLAVPVARRLKVSTSDAGRRLNLGIVAVVLLVGIAVQPGVLHRQVVGMVTEGLARRGGEGASLLGYENATAALEQIQRRTPDARIFHDQALGGMIEWYLARPEHKQVAFVDQRMEMVTQEVWDDYFEVMSGEGWRDVLDRWNVDVVVVRVDEQWTLIQRLMLASEWSLVFVDEVHLVFVRGDAATQWRSAPI
ncbi:MAG: hypothetical protein R3E66_04150 [bacterium]